MATVVIETVRGVKVEYDSVADAIARLEAGLKMVDSARSALAKCGAMSLPETRVTGEQLLIDGLDQQLQLL